MRERERERDHKVSYYYIKMWTKWVDKEDKVDEAYYQKQKKTTACKFKRNKSKTKVCRLK